MILKPERIETGRGRRSLAVCTRLMAPTEKIAVIRYAETERQFKYFEWSASNTEAILAGKCYPHLEEVADVLTVFDVGANVGAASIYFNATYADARVYAFEPCPETFRILMANTAHVRTVRAFNFGLFDRTETTRLYQSSVDPVTRSIGASVHNTEKFTNVALIEAAHFVKKHRTARIDVLKIDTEGCEVPILRSLLPHLPLTQVIYLETHSDHDRMVIDRLLEPTHILYQARVVHPHRGELVYLGRERLGADLARHEIRIDRARSTVTPSG